MPHEVVFIGHFDDPLVTDCTHIGAATCRDFFVVDQLAWLDGVAQGVRIGQPERPTRVLVPQSFEQVEGIVSDRVGTGTQILSVTTLPERDLSTLDPTTGLDTPSDRTVWYVRAVEAGTHRLGGKADAGLPGTVRSRN